MDDDRILTKAKSALKLAHIIRYENGHEIIDVSLLRTIQDAELMKFRNVGKATIEKIREIRKSLQWVEAKKKSYLCIKHPYRVVLIANEAFCPGADRGLLFLPW